MTRAGGEEMNIELHFHPRSDLPDFRFPTTARRNVLCVEAGGFDPVRPRQIDRSFVLKRWLTNTIRLRPNTSFARTTESSVLKPAKSGTIRFAGTPRATKACRMFSGSL